MIRRRPIPRSNYAWVPSPKGPSLRFELIQNGAVRKYPDGREVCQDSPAGRREYRKRVEKMVRRQNFICCLCPDRLYLNDVTFEHQRRRGLHAAFRDDRIVDSEGREVNGAAHWICNVERG